jgi:hypothetical protein
MCSRQRVTAWPPPRDLESEISARFRRIPPPPASRIQRIPPSATPPALHYCTPAATQHMLATTRQEPHQTGVHAPKRGVVITGCSARQLACGAAVQCRRIGTNARPLIRPGARRSKRHRCVATGAQSGSPRDELPVSNDAWAGTIALQAYATLVKRGNRTEHPGRVASLCKLLRIIVVPQPTLHGLAQAHGLPNSFGGSLDGSTSRS